MTIFFGGAGSTNWYATAKPIPATSTIHQAVANRSRSERRPALILAIILETAVGRASRHARVGAWREATTRQAHACKEERQSQVPARACRLARSEITHRMILIETDKFNVHAALQICNKRSSAVSRITAGRWWSRWFYALRGRDAPGRHRSMRSAD